MLTDPFQIKLAANVASLVHKDKKFDAAKLLDDALGLNLKIPDEPEKYIPVLQNWFAHLMAAGAPEQAAQLLWTSNKFTPEPQFTKSLWKLFDRSSMGLVMGGASCSKSYSLGGVRLMLEWLADPAWTSIKIIGPSEDHLQTNLFSHLVDLHRSASLPLPGKVGELFIGLDRRNQLSSIKGVVIPKGENVKAGRIQGIKRKARDNPHPIYGSLSRLFLFLDEIENVPGGIWSDIENVLSNIQEAGDTSGFKIFAAWNPKDISHEVASRAEPPLGWESFDIEEDYEWVSKRGWDVLRLDGEKCENVVQNKVVYPGLQTRAGLETMARNSGGKQSAGYYSQGRGAYPPRGIELTVVPTGMLPKARGEFIWFDTPVPVASCDLALEGGDAAPYTLGRWGLATGIKYPASVEHPEGNKVIFKDKNGNNIQRWGLQIESQFSVPKGDTVAMKNSLIELNRKAGVRGHFFCVDRTGVGAGTADLIRHEWSSSIIDVNLSEAASEGKIFLEDTKTCKEQFERINSELWFAMRGWMEFQYLLFTPGFDMAKLGPQLTTRRFRTSGGKSRVESKKDFETRNGNNESPNEADGITFIVHAARKGSGVTLSMLMEGSEVPGEADDYWPAYQGGVRLTADNRTDYLDQRIA